MLDPGGAHRLGRICHKRPPIKKGCQSIAQFINTLLTRVRWSGRSDTVYGLSLPLRNLSQWAVRAGTGF